jgi:hypothetical protein
MGERRAGQRRTGEMPAVEQPVQERQKKDRREGDRRDSPRLPVKLWVRDPEVGGSFEERQGDVGTGGLYFVGDHPPLGSVVEARFTVPGRNGDIRVKGEVIRVEATDRGRYNAHLKFVSLDVETELAIAKYVDDEITASGAFKK